MMANPVRVTCWQTSDGSRYENERAAERAEHRLAFLAWAFKNWSGDGDEATLAAVWRYFDTHPVPMKEGTT